MADNEKTIEAQPESPDLAAPSEEDREAVEEGIKEEAASQNVPADTTTGLPTCAQMREILSRPIPARLIKTMRNYGGGAGAKPISYLHWTTVKKFLDFRSPGWQYHVVNIVTTELGVAVSTEIHVPCSDGVLIASGIGFEPHRQGKDNKPTGFGGAAVVAERQAFKRASAMLGLGFDLYAS